MEFYEKGEKWKKKSNSKLKAKVKKGQNGKATNLKVKSNWERR